MIRIVKSLNHRGPHLEQQGIPSTFDSMDKIRKDRNRYETSNTDKTYYDFLSGERQVKNQFDGPPTVERTYDSMNEIKGSERTYDTTVNVGISYPTDDEYDSVEALGFNANENYVYHTGIYAYACEYDSMPNIIH